MFPARGRKERPLRGHFAVRRKEIREHPRQLARRSGQGQHGDLPARVWQEQQRICTIFARQEQRIRRIRYESGRAGGGNLLGGKDKRPAARSVPTKDTQIQRNGKHCAVRAGEQGGGIGCVKGIFRQCGVNQQQGQQETKQLLHGEKSSGITPAPRPTRPARGARRARFRPPRWRGRASQRRSKTGGHTGGPSRRGRCRSWRGTARRPPG